MQEIWRRILNLDEVNDKTDFFKSGAGSMDVVRSVRVFTELLSILLLPAVLTAVLCLCSVCWPSVLLYSVVVQLSSPASRPQYASCPSVCLSVAYRLSNSKTKDFGKPKLPTMDTVFIGLSTLSSVCF